MKIDQAAQEKIQELQLSEQHLQNFLFQKQAFESELNEVESAEEETKKAEGDVFKIVGQVMVKAKKQEVLDELKEKKDLLNLRLKSINNQEKILTDKLEKIRKELEEKLKPGKK